MKTSVNKIFSAKFKVNSKKKLFNKYYDFNYNTKYLYVYTRTLCIKLYIDRYYRILYNIPVLL